MKTNTYEILKERGYIYQCTNENALKEKLNNECVTFYLGIDPTADSLHIGHFFALTMVRRLQKMGHKAIVLIGGATAMIGDPSGRSDLRRVMPEEEVIHNKNEVKELVKRFVDIDGENPAIIVDNSDWTSQEKYIDFLRKVGIHFNVNKMLATDCYKKRLEEGGLTFLEMGYMLMQANDFVHLNSEYGCTLQIGGSDQWVNILAGTELYRKLNNLNDASKEELFGLTCPLLVKADGEKMGKTSTGTLWVSRNKTTVFDFYQMFRNSYDEDVPRLLSFFSDIEISEIDRTCKEDIINAKKVMAYEVTKLVHGENEAKKALETAESIFENKSFDNNMPTKEIEKNQVNNIVDLLMVSELVPSKSEARRLIEQGGISIDNIKITDVNEKVNKDEVVVQKGKKTFLKIVLK